MTDINENYCIAPDVWDAFPPDATPEAVLERAARDTLEHAAAQARANILGYDTEIGAHGEKVLKRTTWEEHHAAKRAGQPANYVDVLPQSAIRIARECDRIKAFLVEKNMAYGDSATDPIRLFSRADTVEQLLVRIDDKLSRVQRGTGEYPGDDTVLDLIGYLVLLRIAKGQS